MVSRAIVPISDLQIPLPMFTFFRCLKRCTHVWGFQERAERRSLTRFWHMVFTKVCRYLILAHVLTDGRVLVQSVNMVQIS